MANHTQTPGNLGRNSVDNAVVYVQIPVREKLPNYDHLLMLLTYEEI